MPALVISDISKIYPSRDKGAPVVALDGVSLSIPEGTIHGLLGPNGAGKSTLISIISGMLLPTSGKAELFGVDVVKEPERAKSFLGVVPQELVLEVAFTVEEVLYYFAGMYGMPAVARNERVTEVLAALDLADKRQERARTLSGGMKRRLMIAKAIMHRPRVLILDEPTAGVDVLLRQRIWNLVRELNSAGTTILFTTHYLEEAEELCEAITLINRGQVIKQGRLADIQREFAKNAIHFELFDQTVPQLAYVAKVGQLFELPVNNLAADMAAVIEHYGTNLKSVKSDVPSLERIFLELTK